MLLLIQALLATTVATEPPPIGVQGNMGRDDPQAEDEPERVLLDDGGYYYPLLPELKTEPVVVDGPTIWRYDGQQVYQIREEPASRVVQTIVPESILTDVSLDAAAYLGVGKTTRVDRYGRRWLLVGVDSAALWKKLNDYDALVRSEFGVEPGSQERTGIAHNKNAGERETVVLDTAYGHVWNLDECTDDTTWDVEDHLFGGITEGLTDISSPTSIQSTVVFMMAVGDDGVQFRGSGVMVDSDTVLTAAHNIANGTGELDPRPMRVCSLGNVYSGSVCRTVSNVIAKGGYHDELTDHDYGILTLNSTMPTTVGWMAMSSAGDTILEYSTHYHVGYPRRKPACVQNLSSSASVIVQSGTYAATNPATHIIGTYQYFGSWLMTAYGPTYGIYSGHVNFSVSSASQMSGSPYYYCPEGCTTGAPYITAVTSAHSESTPMFTNGPKARTFRDWVITFM